MSSHKSDKFHFAAIRGSPLLARVVPLQRDILTLNSFTWKRGSEALKRNSVFASVGQTSTALKPSTQTYILGMAITATFGLWLLGGKMERAVHVMDLRTVTARHEGFLGRCPDYLERTCRLPLSDNGKVSNGILRLPCQAVNARPFQD